MHLTAVCLLRDYLSSENHRELLTGASNKTKLQVQELLARRFPRPDVASYVRKLPSHAPCAASEQALRPTPPVPPTPRPTPTRALVEPTSEARYRIPESCMVEMSFKLRGVAHRLAGVMQWMDRQATAGVQFLEMAWRRKTAVEEVLSELEAEAQAKAAKEAAAKAEAEEAGSGGEAAQKSQEIVKQGQVTQALANSVGGRKGPPPGEREQPRLVKPAAMPEPVRKPGRERRVQSRHSVDSSATIFFIDVGAQCSGRLLDVSLSGCRIRTDEPFPSGIYRRVEVEFTMDGLRFRLAGVVQSLHDRRTIGIRLLDLSDRKREQLATLMEELDEAQRRENAKNGIREKNEVPQAEAV